MFGERKKNAEKKLRFTESHGGNWNGSCQCLCSAHHYTAFKCWSGAACIITDHIDDNDLMCSILLKCYIDAPALSIQQRQSVKLMRVKSPNFDNKTTIINCNSHSFLMRTHTILILSLFLLRSALLSLCVPLFGSGRLAEREADTWSPNEISKTHQQSEPMKTVNEKINQLILRSLAPHLFTASTTQRSMWPVHKIQVFAGFWVAHIITQ